MVEFDIMHHPKHHRKLSRKTRFTRAIIALIISFCLIVGGIAMLWVSTLQIPDLSVFETRKVAESTKIFDRTGQILLYDIHQGSKRTEIPYENIARNIKNATIAIEDANFYNHIGIEPKSIVRAVIADIIPGGQKQGGSTITQQVIKNSVLTKDQTITRKLKEWVLAIKLERVLTKDQILNTYLNESPYGGNIYGVEEASKAFFGKSAKDVTLAESAYLAALPQAPTFYSPYGKNKEALDKRQRLVLSKMLEYNFISQAEYDQATKEEVTFLAKNDGNLRAPHFTLMVRDYLIDKYGEDAVNSGGLRVTTSLNFDMQQKMEKVISNFAPHLEESFGASNTAMVAIDPKTGDILALVGSRDYYDNRIDGNFNIATAHRQPGSTFKPFVYATAFEKGYTPDTILFDVKTEFSNYCNPDSTLINPNVKPSANGKSATSTLCYSPSDYDDLFEGPMTMRTALAQSRNVPAVKTLYLAGIADSIQTAENMGINGLDDPNRYGLTLVLGGGEVSLLDITSAYGVFANDGIRNPYRDILKVEDSKGNVLEESINNPVQVIPAQNARQISDILSDPKVRLDSLSALIDPLNRQVAIKTGTTNDYKDVWVEGYTPDLVVGAWAGKNDNTAMEKKVAGLIIAPVWGAFMSEVAGSLPDALPQVSRFKSPEPTPIDAKPVLRGIWTGGVSYIKDNVSGKVATEFTPPETRTEVVFPSVHDILHWVDKTNPNGPIPEHPENDGQYEKWEYGVRKWYDAWHVSNPGFQEVATFTIPTEKDNVHVPENAPKISITSPSNSTVLDSKTRVQVSMSVQAKNPIKKVELYINDRYIISSEQSPFTISFTPSDIKNLNPTGLQNTLKIVVYDTALNRGEASINFGVNN